MNNKKLDPLEIDAYNVLKGALRSNYSQYWNILTEHVQILYKILLNCGYTETEAIDKLHTDISKETKLSLWDITKITKGVKK